MKKFTGLRTQVIVLHHHPMRKANTPDTVVDKVIHVDIELAIAHEDEGEKQLTFHFEEEKVAIANLTELVPVRPAKLDDLPLCQAQGTWVAERVEVLGKSAVVLHLVDLDRFGFGVLPGDVGAPLLKIGVYVT